MVAGGGTARLAVVIIDAECRPTKYYHVDHRIHSIITRVGNNTEKGLKDHKNCAVKSGGFPLNGG